MSQKLFLCYWIPQRAAIVWFMSFSFLSINLFYVLYKLLLSSLLYVCSFPLISGLPQLFISLLRSMHFHSAVLLEIPVWEYYNMFLPYCFFLHGINAKRHIVYFFIFADTVDLYLIN